MDVDSLSVLAFWALNLFGILVDSIFMTIFYYHKREIPKYFTLLLSVSISIILISKLCPFKDFSKILLLCATIFFVFIFSKERPFKFTSTFYVAIPFIAIGSFEKIIVSVFGVSLLAYVFSMMVKLFVLTSSFEDVKFKVEFNLLNITNKVLFILCIFLVYCLTVSMV